MNLAILTLFLSTTLIMEPLCVSSVLARDRHRLKPFDGFLPNNTFGIGIESLMQKSKAKELELEKAQKLNKNFERMIQLVNILGQVDSFVSERTKSVLRKLALLAEDDGGSYRRRRS